MKEKLRMLDLQIMQVRHQLSSFQSWVSPSDIKDGYTADALKKRLLRLEQDRQQLLRYCCS